MLVSSYCNIDSRIHRMNPLAKIICIILYMIALFITYELVPNIILTVLLLILILNSNVPFKKYFKLLLGIRWLIIFVFIINLIFKNNLYETFIIILRLIYAVLDTSVLIYTTKTNDITYGLEMLLKPLQIFKLPVSKMALSISIAIHFLPNMIDQGNKIIKSQVSRGIDLYSYSIKEKIISLKSLIIPMFILTFKQADNLADIMEVRLYDINKTRKHLVNKWGIYDIFLILVYLFILIAIVVKGVVLWDI